MEIRGNLALNDNQLQDFVVDAENGSFPTAVEGKLVYRVDLSNLFVCVQVTPSPVWYPLASPSAMYVHTQAIGDNVWDINHSLGSSDVFVQVYDLGGYQIIPGEIRIVDESNVQITFDNNIVSGKAIIAALSEGDAQIGLKDLNDVAISSPLNGDSLVYNSATMVWQNKAIGGFVLPIHVETAAYQAVAGDQISADTETIGSFTVTLPSAPARGTRVFIIDEKGYWATNNLTVIPFSGERIRGTIDDSVIMDLNHYIAEFIYINPTIGWTFRLDS